MEKLKCCFCGKELNDIRECNNPSPLSSQRDDVCCGFCDRTLVIPFRTVLWHPWVTENMAKKIIKYFGELSADELRDVLPKRMIINKDEWDEYIQQLNIL